MNGVLMNYHRTYNHKGYFLTTSCLSHHYENYQNRIDGWLYEKVSVIVYTAATIESVVIAFGSYRNADFEEVKRKWKLGNGRNRLSPDVKLELLIQLYQVNLLIFQQ